MFSRIPKKTLLCISLVKSGKERDTTTTGYGQNLAHVSIASIVVGEELHLRGSANECCIVFLQIYI